MRGSSGSGSGSDKKACELPGNGLARWQGVARRDGTGQLDRQLERQGHLAAAKIAKLKLKCECCNERAALAVVERMHYAYAACAAPSAAVAKTSQSN